MQFCVRKNVFVLKSHAKSMVMVAVAVAGLDGEWRVQDPDAKVPLEETCTKSAKNVNNYAKHCIKMCISMDIFVFIVVF